MNKKVEAVFKLLGVEPGETFKISGSDEVLTFDKKLKLKRIDDKGKEHEVKHSLESLLADDVKIEKTISLTAGEQVISAGFYAAGYRYIARSADGSLLAYFEKPTRGISIWCGGTAAIVKCSGFYWITWESGPYELREEAKGGKDDAK